MQYKVKKQIYYLLYLIQCLSYFQSIECSVIVGCPSDSSYKPKIPFGFNTNKCTNFVSLFQNYNLKKECSLSTTLLKAHSNSYNAKSRLGRGKSHRNCLLRNLATQLLRHGSVYTTRSRAKAVQPFVDRLITYAKRSTYHSYVLANGKLYDRQLTNSLFREAAIRYKERSGGYTHIRRAPFARRGDGATMALVELV